MGKNCLLAVAIVAFSLLPVVQLSQFAFCMPPPTYPCNGCVNGAPATRIICPAPGEEVGIMVNVTWQFANNIEINCYEDVYLMTIIVDIILNGTRLGGGSFGDGAERGLFLSSYSSLQDAPTSGKLNLTQYGFTGNSSGAEFQIELKTYSLCAESYSSTVNCTFLYGKAINECNVGIASGSDDWTLYQPCRKAPPFTGVI